MQSSPSGGSISTWVQYAFFAVVVYVLAGAPLSNILNEGGRTGVGGGNIAQEKMDSLVVPERNLKCGEHAYKGVHILNREPLVLYIEAFVSEEERRHVVNVRYARTTLRYEG